MKKAEDALSNNNLLDKANIILQVHDELIYEVKDGHEKEVSDIIKQALEDIIPKDFLEGKEEVPLVVSVSVGKTWGDLK